MTNDKNVIAEMLTDLEQEHAILAPKKRTPRAKVLPIATEPAPAPAKRKQKVYNHLKPREAKEQFATQRKEVLLTLPIIEKLQRKAKRANLDLKKFMEQVLIKVAAEKDFDTSI